MDITLQSTGEKKMIIGLEYKDVNNKSRSLG